MKFKSTLITMSVSALFLSGMANATITGTSSAEMTFTSTITAGTCTAKMLNSAGAEATDINFGDVFKSEVENKSRVEPLKIAFSNCAGVSKATVSSAPGSGGGCSGPASNGDSYAAGLATGFEIWSGAVDAGVLLSCITPVSQDVAITAGAGEYPMNSRIVVARGRTIADVGTGAVSAPVTFTITYQ